MRRALASIGAEEVDDAVRALKELFFHARTYRHWLPHDVSDHTLRSLYEAVKVAPTSCNCSPGRFVFVRSREARARLLACVAPHDVESARAAPVTVVIAEDLRFYLRLPKLFPVRDLTSTFSSKPHVIGETAFPPIGELPYFLTFGPHSFYWFRLERPSPVAV